MVVNSKPCPLLDEMRVAFKAKPNKPREGGEPETAVLPGTGNLTQSRELKGVSGVMRLAESTPVKLV